MAKPLKAPVKIKPLDPDKPLMPTRTPALKAFDKHMPGQLTLEDMGVIEQVDEIAVRTADAAPQDQL